MLDRLEPGDDVMDAPRSLAAAGEVLAGGNNPAKEVVIFGTPPSSPWRQVAASSGRTGLRCFPSLS